MWLNVAASVPPSWEAGRKYLQFSRRKSPAHAVGISLSGNCQFPHLELTRTPTTTPTSPDSEPTHPQSRKSRLIWAGIGETSRAETGPFQQFATHPTTHTAWCHRRGCWVVSQWSGKPPSRRLVANHTTTWKRCCSCLLGSAPVILQQNSDEPSAFPQLGSGIVWVRWVRWGQHTVQTWAKP